jgi:hypothetical protein
MDKISRLKKKENKLVMKGKTAKAEGKEKKANRVLGRAAKAEDRMIKTQGKKKYGC